MPPAFVALKEEDKLGLGVQCDGAAWLTEIRKMTDFNLKTSVHDWDTDIG